MSASFHAWKPLIVGCAEPACRAIVIVPARNEEESIAATLDAFAAQVDLEGQPLQPAYFEVLLLLNNCTDNSAGVAAAWAKRHPKLRIQVIQRTLAADQAFVGTARRMLMDTALMRLSERDGICAILSTDSDTIVANDWIARIMAALCDGVDAVGGVVKLKPGEFHKLPRAVRLAYRRDRRYQRLVAELEDRLDPQEGDPWPRHLEHFGASLACTTEVYAKAGGMPPITPLEDVAFVGQLRRVGARLRHDPAVKVFTSSRIDGRVEVGLSGQLRIWQQMGEQGQAHLVQSSAWLAHRFRTLGRLRKEAAAVGVLAADYLAQVDCDRVVDETFCGGREGEITRVNRRLAAMLKDIAPTDQGGNPHDAAHRPHAIRAAQAMPRALRRRSADSRRPASCDG